MSSCFWVLVLFNLLRLVFFLEKCDNWSLGASTVNETLWVQLSREMEFGSSRWEADYSLLKRKKRKKKKNRGSSEVVCQLNWDQKQGLKLSPRWLEEAFAWVQVSTSWKVNQSHYKSQRRRKSFSGMCCRSGCTSPFKIPCQLLSSLSLNSQSTFSTLIQSPLFSPCLFFHL